MSGSQSASSTASPTGSGSGSGSGTQTPESTPSPQESNGTTDGVQDVEASILTRQNFIKHIWQPAAKSAGYSFIRATGTHFFRGLDLQPTKANKTISYLVPQLMTLGAMYFLEGQYFSLIFNQLVDGAFYALDHCFGLSDKMSIKAFDYAKMALVYGTTALFSVAYAEESSTEALAFWGTALVAGMLGSLVGSTLGMPLGKALSGAYCRAAKTSPRTPPECLAARPPRIDTGFPGNST